MEGMFIHIVNMGITASWVILAVIAGRFLLKKAPRKLVVLLWGLVALRLILPFSVESPTSLVPSATTLSPSIEYAARPQIQSGIPILNEAVNPVIGTALAPAPFSSVNPVQVVTFVASNLWIIGMLLFLAYAFASSLRLRRKVREAVPLRDNIWICDQVETPFVLGIIRPRIYLPSWIGTSEADILANAAVRGGFPQTAKSAFADGTASGTSANAAVRGGFPRAAKSESADSPDGGFSADGSFAGPSVNTGEIQYVLAHERAHLSRRDPLWKALGFLLLMVYWFHPLVWVAYILFCRDIEAACDEKVIHDMDMAGKKAYARALVSFGRKQRTVLVCPLAFGEVGVKERVKGVLHYKKPGFWIILAAFAVCALIAVCFVTNPVKKDAEPEAPAVRIIKVKTEGIKSLVSKIREDGMVPVKWFAADSGETEVGWIFPFQMEQYLADAAWEECEAPEDLPDSEHLRILTRSKYYVTIYDEPALAHVHLEDGDRFYRITDADYEAVRELFRAYSQKGVGIFNDDVPAYTPYVGDASATGSVARSLPYPEGYTYDSIQIWSESEPYGLDVLLRGPILLPEEELPRERRDTFRTCAESAFASIGNLGSIRFYAVDEYGQRWFLYGSDRPVEGVATGLPYGTFRCGSEMGPCLTLEKGEKFDQFIFSYDLLSSYLPYGNAVRQGDTIVCRTDDGKCHYTFTVKDENTLLFVAGKSSPVTRIDEKISGEPVEDGSVFVRIPAGEGES